MTFFQRETLWVKLFLVNRCQMWHFLPFCKSRNCSLGMGVFGKLKLRNLFGELAFQWISCERKSEDVWELFFSRNTKFKKYLYNIHSNSDDMHTSVLFSLIPKWLISIIQVFYLPAAVNRQASLPLRAILAKKESLPFKFSHYLFSNMWCYNSVKQMFILFFNY